MWVKITRINRMGEKIYTGKWNNSTSTCDAESNTDNDSCLKQIMLYVIWNSK